MLVTSQGHIFVWEVFQLGKLGVWLEPSAA